MRRDPAVCAEDRPRHREFTETAVAKINDAGEKRRMEQAIEAQAKLANPRYMSQADISRALAAHIENERALIGGKSPVNLMPPGGGHTRKLS